MQVADRPGNWHSLDETGESIEKNQTDRISESTENTEKSQTDGTNPVVYMPKVLVQSYQCTVLSSVSNEEESDGSISPGDKFSLSITLVNTSKTESVKNMAVKMTLPEENFVLCSASDSQYIDTLYAGSTVTVTYHLQTDLSVSQGQYDIGLDYSYADSEATEYTSSGVAKVMVGKSVEMKFDSPQLPAEVEIADVIETSVQAMNLSRSTVYNVRTEIEADGLVPAGTIYIGDIEAGMAASASTQISITGLTQSDYPYGKTSEVVKCYYEDEAGNEYTETGEFQTEIQSAFSEQSEEEEDQPGQWWVIMIIIAIIIEILMVAVLVKYVKKHKGWRKDESMDQYMD